MKQKFKEHDIFLRKLKKENPTEFYSQEYIRLIENRSNLSLALLKNLKEKDHDYKKIRLSVKNSEKNINKNIKKCIFELEKIFQLEG